MEVQEDDGSTLSHKKIQGLPKEEALNLVRVTGFESAANPPLRAVLAACGGLNCKRPLVLGPGIQDKQTGVPFGTPVCLVRVTGFEPAAS